MIPALKALWTVIVFTLKYGSESLTLVDGLYSTINQLSEPEHKANVSKTLTTILAQPMKRQERRQMLKALRDTTASMPQQKAT